MISTNKSFLRFVTAVSIITPLIHITALILLRTIETNDWANPEHTIARYIFVLAALLFIQQPIYLLWALLSFEVSIARRLLWAAGIFLFQSLAFPFLSFYKLKRLNQLEAESS